MSISKPEKWKTNLLVSSQVKRKSILQVPDTGTWVLNNTRPFLHSSIVSFWITPACSKECKYHIFRQYWYTRNVRVLTNTETFQYLGPEVYFFCLKKKKKKKKLIICFEIHRSAESKRALWKIGDVSNAAAQGTLRAKFELTEGPSKPSTLAVQFSSEGTTLSGLDIDLLNTSYRLSLIKKRFTSGKNLS